MKNTITIILFCLISSLIYSQKAVKGWDKATWGMTQMNVKSLYPESKLIENDDPKNLFVIGKDSLRAKVSMSYTILNYDFEVLFVFKKGKLDLVTLNYNGNVKKEIVFKDISNLLIEKYGQPSKKEDANIDYFNLLNGNINLSYLSFNDKFPLIISYEKKKSNKL